MLWSIPTDILRCKAMYRLPIGQAVFEKEEKLWGRRLRVSTYPVVMQSR